MPNSINSIATATAASPAVATTQTTVAPSASPQGGRVSRTPQWPAKYQLLIDVLTTGSAGSLDDLKARSPYPTDVDPDVFIAALFPGNPWLCHAFSKGYFGTRLRGVIVPGVLATSQFIVPSPMVAQKGMTKGPNPHLSEHTEAATGPRAYLVVEFDDELLSRDDQARLALHLASLAPLVMEVDSAGKSLHCWFACQGQSEQLLQTFFSYAVSLGADPRTWGKSQFVRMPGGLRKAEKRGQPKRRQVVHYFDPSPATQWASLSTLSEMPKESTPVPVTKAPPGKSPVTSVPKVIPPALPTTTTGSEAVDDEALRLILKDTIPTQAGGGDTRRFRLKLCQRIRGYEKHHAPTDGQRETIFAAWFTTSAAAGTVNPARGQAKYCAELRASYPRVSVAASFATISLAAIVAGVVARGSHDCDNLPEAAMFKDPEARRLLAICRALGEVPKAGHEPGEFFLSEADTAKLLGCKKRRAKFLRDQLCNKGVLEVVEKGRWICRRGAEWPKRATVFRLVNEPQQPGEWVI